MKQTQCNVDYARGYFAAKHEQEEADVVIGLLIKALGTTIPLINNNQTAKAAICQAAIDRAKQYLEAQV